MMQGSGSSSNHCDDQEIPIAASATAAADASSSTHSNVHNKNNKKKLQASNETKGSKGMGLSNPSSTTTAPAAAIAATNGRSSGSSKNTTTATTTRNSNHNHSSFKRPSSDHSTQSCSSSSFPNLDLESSPNQDSSMSSNLSLPQPKQVASSGIPAVKERPQVEQYFNHRPVDKNMKKGHDSSSDSSSSSSNEDDDFIPPSLADFVHKANKALEDTVASIAAVTPTVGGPAELSTIKETTATKESGQNQPKRNGIPGPTLPTTRAYSDSFPAATGNAATTATTKGRAGRNQEIGNQIPGPTAPTTRAYSDSFATTTGSNAARKRASSGARASSSSSSDHFDSQTNGALHHSTKPEPHSGRGSFSRAQSQPVFANLKPTTTRTLPRQSSMTERVNKLRSSVFQRPVRLNRPTITRSKSDVPRSFRDKEKQEPEQEEEEEEEEEYGETTTCTTADLFDDSHDHVQQKRRKERQSMTNSNITTQPKARSLSSSPISKYNFDTRLRNPGQRDDYGRPNPLPTTAFDSSVTASTLGTPALGTPALGTSALGTSAMGINRGSVTRSNNTSNNARNRPQPRRRSRRRGSGSTLGHVSEDEESSSDGNGDGGVAGEDVLMMIAKARVKLEMQDLSAGDDQLAMEEARAVLKQLQQQERDQLRRQQEGPPRQQQQQQQHQDREDLENQKIAAMASGSSIQSGGNLGGLRSATSSVNGTASMPGAYAVKPGAGSERLENASLSRYSDSAQHSKTNSHSNPSSLLGAFSDGDSESDSHSISSAEGYSQGMNLEIEFSQQSFSNLNDGDDGDRKPPAVDHTNVYDGSAHLSAGSISLGPDEVFDRKKPANTYPVPETPRSRMSTRRTARSFNRANSFGALSAGRDSAMKTNDNNNTYASYASMPAAAPLSAPSTLSDDDSEASSTKRRRRQRRIRRRDHRHGNFSFEEERDTKMPSKPTKDGSGDSSTSQLVIAAEVVRSEEEVVEELREKVEKEILESMAKELHDMEASMSAFSERMDLSLANSDVHTPTSQGQRGLLLSRMSSLSTMRSYGARSQQSTPGTHCSGMTEPPSPAPASIQRPTTRKGRLPDITPNQTRRLRSLNLSGASPAFLRRPRKEKNAKATMSVQQAPRKIKNFFGKKSMPTLAKKSSLDEASSSSSSEDESVDSKPSKQKRSSAPGRVLDIVDALDVIPASPPPPQRAQSQPVVSPSLTAPELQPQRRRGSVGGGGPTPILDQLRSMANSSPPAENAVASTSRDSTSPVQPVQAQNSEPGDLQRQESLPDLKTPQPPPPPHHHHHHHQPSPPPPPSLLERISGVSLGGRMSVSSSGRLSQGPPRTPFGSSVHSSFSSAYSSALRHSHSGGSLVQANTFGSGDHTEFEVMNNHHDHVAVDIQHVPGNWDLHQQMELAELGRAGRLGGPVGQYFPHPQQQQSGSYGPYADVQAASSVAATGQGEIHVHHHHHYHEGSVISYDDRVTMAWVTPIGLLVAGAVVLGLVLFAV